MTKLAEYSAVNDSNRSKVETLAKAWSGEVRAIVALRNVGPGYEPAGSVARYTDGYYSVRWQESSGAYQGRRYTLTQEGRAQAQAHYARLTGRED